MSELKSIFQTHNLLLTTTLIAVHEKILEHLAMFTLSKHIDFMHFLQWYTFVGGSNLNRHQLSLNMRGMQNLQNVIDTAIAVGAPREKIVLGIQFLPTVFDKLSDVERFGYEQVCDLNGKYDVKQGLNTADKQMPILWTFLPEKERYIYESSRSIANKVRFAVRRDLGGIMAFAIDYDDFNGNCKPENDTFIDFEINDSMSNVQMAISSNFPLLNTINKAIFLAIDEKKQEQNIDQHKSNKTRNWPLHDKIVVCYTLTKPDRLLITTPVENINLNLCTHLICIDNIWNATSSEGIHFVFLREKTVFFSSNFLDFAILFEFFHILSLCRKEPWHTSTNYKQFTNLQQKYSHLKVNDSFMKFKCLKNINKMDFLFADFDGC